MKNKILNEIHRISTLMGNENILSEQIAPKILKKFFSVLDDDAARQVLKATDNSQDDLIRKLRAGESLSDDAMELLLKVIDYDLLAKNLVDQKLLGDRLNANIEKIITVLKENPERYDELTKRMDDVIEKVGLNNKFPDELITGVKKDVRSRIDDGIGDAATKVDDINIDDLLNSGSVVDDIPTGTFSDETKKTIRDNEEKFKRFVRRAKKRGSMVQDFTIEQYNQAFNELSTGMKEMDPKVFNEFQKVYRTGWWSGLPLWKKALTVLSATSVGPTAVTIIWYSTIARFTNWQDVVWIKEFFTNATGEISELTQSNVKDHLISKYPIDEPSFENEYKIYISQDGKSARVRGPKNYTVKVSDGQITSTEN